MKLKNLFNYVYVLSVNEYVHVNAGAHRGQSLGTELRPSTRVSALEH